MDKIIKTFINNFQNITEYYNFIVNKTKNHEYIGIINEELIDNYYLLVKHKNKIINSKIKLDKKNIKNYYLLKNIITKNNYNIDFDYLVKELNNYQSETAKNFSYQELNNIFSLIVFIYTDRLNNLCHEEYIKIVDIEDITKIIESKEELSVIDFIPNNFDLINNYHYIFEVNNQLRRTIKNTHELFKDLDNYLKESQVSLKEIINEEYQKKIANNLLMTNIIENLKEIYNYSLIALYEKVSKVEKKLLTDETYKNMTKETKEVYRNQLIKLSKKNHCDEMTYLESIFDKSIHIGNKLFKSKKNTFKVLLYFTVLFLLTTLLSYFLSNYFIKIKLLGFLILYLPILFLTKQIMNAIITYFIPTNIIKKLDYSKGIPTESQTMIVIPQVLKTKESVKEIFDNLESIYLINKFDNLYFTLLGDATVSSKKVESIDKEISEYGKEYAEKLNKKYKKDIFYFIYRKRLWNPKENAYISYELKRGALYQFNKILLGEYLDETKYFNINTLQNHNLNIKYVITIDSNTKVGLNSIPNLIGAMAHPMNEPILNSKETKVVSGYGMLQPRISIDIESTNKSLYSKIFAGIGGFNNYTTIIPNIYQDLFLEESFQGKGIYNLEVFNKLLENTIPDNHIISSNILEGSYLRCGYTSDIELISSFPKDFLEDTKNQQIIARSDIQIIGWLLNRVLKKDKNKVKNKVNLLGKLKIFDNILKLFLNPALLLILFLAFTLDKKSSLLWIIFVLLEIILLTFFHLNSKTYKEFSSREKAYCKNVYFDFKGILLRIYITLATIPYYTKIYITTFTKTLYRLLVSHKNLLDLDKLDDFNKKNNPNLLKYLYNFIFNIIIALTFIIIGILTSNYTAYILALIFLSVPFILYFVSKDTNDENNSLDEEKISSITETAKLTWKYFEDNLTEENNYLIPNNYQENRDELYIDITTPSNIGFSLTSIISAYELEFITEEKAMELLESILKVVNSLPKWHGHLYNNYNIKTKEVSSPKFISSKESGVFATCLLTTREFLNNKDSSELVKLCDRLLKNINFKKLYTSERYFSVGYDEEEGILQKDNYQKFASLSLLTSFLGISIGNIPVNHWFNLDKTLTKYKGKKGLLSTNGTAIEYFLPHLFFKDYPNTLLKETYDFVLFCQKEYLNKISPLAPWGISESAYNDLDNSLNYKVKSFKIPYLKAKEDKNNRIVISPYSSIMVMDIYKDEIIENLNRFRELDMYGKYGYYESYDYDFQCSIKAYFTDHQGMILIGLTNYLKKGIIKNLFHNNINIKAYELLLKEKLHTNASIDMNMVGYQKYNYLKEKIENDIIKLDCLSNYPKIAVLSNKNYSLLINEYGNSFSSYRTLQLNRFRNITKSDYGIYLFIKDTTTNYIWSNTYAPMNLKPDKYEVTFANEKVEFLRKDSSITTKTEIIVSKEQNAEIRKITFKNTNDIDIELELTSYTEPIISERNLDINDKVKNNMFIKTEYDKNTHSLIARRENNEDYNVNTYMFTSLIINNPTSDYSYETERSNFIERNKTISESLEEDLTNFAGDNIDPIMSLRNKILVKANSKTTVYLLIGFGRSREQINNMLNFYNSEANLEKAFEISKLMNIIDTKNMNLTSANIHTFNKLLNYLYQSFRLPIDEDRMDLLRKNALGQSGLWKFGLSGNRPIILIEINDIRDMSFIYEILKAYEYYKNKSIYIDIIIIDNESSKYASIIKKEIEDELYRINTLNSFYNLPGTIIVINNNSITREDRNLLNMTANVKFVIENNKKLEDLVESLKNNLISNQSKILLEDNILVEQKEKLQNDNGFGGFKNNGKEYFIYNKDTPKPWSNIIANKSFGTIVTNNGCGYTYAYNSKEFKLSYKTNENIINDKSEYFKFNNKLFDPTSCCHGFGYSILSSETNELKHEITEFVALEDTCKIYLIKLKNKHKKKENINIEFLINPTLGNVEEKTARYILSEYNEEENYLNMRNTYNTNYNDVNVFITSSEKITKTQYEDVLTKSVAIDITLAASEEKTVIFALGTSQNDKENLYLLSKYNNVTSCTKELKKVKDYWQKTLGKIQVKTPDNSFDYVINGWYLYQTITSRITTKADFNQTRGTLNFKEQLEDAINLASINKEYAKEQILLSAKHQFIEGEVLHWWNEKNHFGLRSRYKDDYLWLVYATIRYLDITNDSSILNEKIPYALGENLSDYETEKKIVFNYSENKDTLLNHCIKSLELAMNSLGQHKIPLIGSGDYDEIMNKVGVKGKGESALLGFFLYTIVNKFIEKMKKYNKKIDLKLYEEFNEKLKDNLNKKTWDGEYYLRAFFDNGDKLGSHENNECKIDLITQSLAILSDVASKDRIQSIITKVEDNLVDKDNKAIKNFSKAFKKTLNNPGEIIKYPKYFSENGGQSTKSASLYLLALIKTGYYDRAYHYFQMINPINRSIKQEDVKKYQLEPYVIANNISVSHNNPGQGSLSWMTSAASWFYKIGIEDILGLHLKGDKLKLTPKIPIAWEGCKIIYKYLDTTYNIEIIKGSKEFLELDGTNQISNTVELVNDSKIHEIKISIK